MNKNLLFVLIGLSIFIVGCSTKKRIIHHDYNSYNNKAKSYIHPTMRSYVVNGVRYHPTAVNVGDEFRGRASWYGPQFHGKLTSSGEKYDMYGMTAAHKTLPMNTMLKVTNLNNGLSVVVRINDRGPFVKSRILDLSKAAAKEIGLIRDGTAPIKFEVIGFKKDSFKKLSLKSKVAMGSYALQIGSFSKIQGAMKIQELYDNTDGYKTVIKDMQGENGRIFKVWLSGFKSEQEVRDYQAQGHFENAFIVREE